MQFDNEEIRAVGRILDQRLESLADRLARRNHGPLRGDYWEQRGWFSSAWRISTSQIDHLIEVNYFSSPQGTGEPFPMVVPCAKVSTPDYGYGDYRGNGYRHLWIVGYRIARERKGCNVSVQEPGFSLNNISHGAHTTDFLAALPSPIDVTGRRA